MTDTRELVDELRLIGCHANGDARCTCVIGQEAADAITAQAEENRRLREALRPFASAWGIAQASGLTDMSRLGALARNEIASVYFMRARSALSSTGEKV